MNSNVLNKKVEIWKYNRSENAGGTPIEGFIFFKHAWAGMRVLNGSLTNDPAPGTVPLTVVEFSMRWDEGISYNCELHYDNTKYRILYIEETKENAWMKIRTMIFNEFE